MRKILVVGPAWVGDMVMAQVLFKILHARKLIVDVLAPPWCADLLARMPEVNEAISYKISHGELGLAKRYQLGKELRAKNYCEAIVLPNSFKSALIPFFAKIPKRTGWLGEFRFGILNNIYYKPKQFALMVQRFAALAYKNLAEVKFELPQLLSTSETKTQTLTKLNLTTQNKILALCPGGEFGSSKRWPTKYFAEVALEKIKAGWQVWILGSPKEKNLALEIMQATNNECIDLIPAANLIDAIDLLAVANIVVTNDSGLMHVAAAVNTPVVVLYGSTSPKFTPPLHANAKILKLDLACQPCFARECPLQHHKCMLDLNPKNVLAAMDEFACVS